MPHSDLNRIELPSDNVTVSDTVTITDTNSKSKQKESTYIELNQIFIVFVHRKCPEVWKITMILFN